MPAQIAVIGQSTTDITGQPGTLVGPQGALLATSPTVFAGGLPVATLGTAVATHGNPFNPKAPGYNPECAETEVAVSNYPNILVQGEPIAHLGSVCFCGHFIINGIPNILVGPT
jgi:uncharacterized Zn-binding protein involved in type VI secretion